MEEFLEKLIKGGGVDPPVNVSKIFSINFPDAMNVEWSREGADYEAVFYLNAIEHIALIDENGNLLQYKMSLQEPNLPGLILDNVHKKGELMHAVLINSGNTIRYECIIRDRELKRWLLLYDDLGNVLTEKLL